MQKYKTSKDFIKKNNFPLVVKADGLAAAREFQFVKQKNMFIKFLMKF